MYKNITKPTSNKGQNEQPSRRNKSGSSVMKSKLSSGKSHSIETPDWFWNQKSYKKK